jgi:hypothetical protein
MDVKKVVLTAAVVMSSIVATCAYGGGGDRGLDLSIPSAIPEQKSILEFKSNGDIVTGTYNADNGRLFLSGPGNKITLGDVDRQGNIVTQEYGGEDGED